MVYGRKSHTMRHLNIFQRQSLFLCTSLRVVTKVLTVGVALSPYVCLGEWSLALIGRNLKRSRTADTVLGALTCKQLRCVVNHSRDWEPNHCNREELAARGLSQAGTKQVLTSRLYTAMCKDDEEAQRISKKAKT